MEIYRAYLINNCLSAFKKNISLWEYKTVTSDQAGQFSERFKIYRQNRTDSNIIVIVVRECGYVEHCEWCLLKLLHCATISKGKKVL